MHNIRSRPLYPRKRDPVPFVQEEGWAPRTVWTGAGNLAPTGIRPTDGPVRSESLRRLSYPGLHVSVTSSLWHFFYVFPTVHHSIGYFFRTNFNAHFNMKMYVTLSSTCFGPWHAHLQEEQLHKHSIWYPRSTRRLHTTPVESGLIGSVIPPEDGHVKARNMSRLMWHTCSYWSVH